MKPDFESLRDLYIVQRLTTRQIAAKIGLSPTAVKNWLRKYNIPRRVGNNGLLYRGQVEPTREELIELVHVQYLGYREIAKQFGVHHTAIPYWLKKHSIPLPSHWDTRRKGQHPVLPTKTELEEMYYAGKSLQTIADHYGTSETTIRRLCKEYSIEVNLSGFNGGKRFQSNDDHLVRSTYEQQVDNWLFEHNIPHIVEPVLPFDHRYHADFLANGWYIEIWGVIGYKVYAERRKHKTQLYQEHNLPLIELEVHYFDSHRKKQWARHLAKKLLTEDIL